MTRGGADRDNFAEDADGGEAGQAREVDRRLRVPVTPQHPPRHRPQREDVPRPRKVPRRAPRVRERCGAAAACAGGRVSAARRG